MQAVGGDRKDPKVQYILFKLDLETVNICISQRIELGTEPGTEPNTETNTELGTEPGMEPEMEPYWRSSSKGKYSQVRLPVYGSRVISPRF
jgi:hypothetical protein